MNQRRSTAREEVAQGCADFRRNLIRRIIDRGFVKKLLAVCQTDPEAQGDTRLHLGRDFYGVLLCRSLIPADVDLTFLYRDAATATQNHEHGNFDKQLSGRENGGYEGELSS
jgi:hypothetical protein